MNQSISLVRRKGKGERKGGERGEEGKGREGEGRGGNRGGAKPVTIL